MVSLTRVQHLVRLQVKVVNGIMGGQCFVKVQGTNQLVFPAEKGTRSIFYCQFYSHKPEEAISVFFKKDGKDVYDNPRKRVIKCSTDGEKKKLFGGNATVANPKFVHYEWLWGVNTTACRLIVEERRLAPAETSTAVVCFAFDPEELKAPLPSGESLSEASSPSMNAGRGRGSGSERPPDETGRGRGLVRRPSVGGRGRGGGTGKNSGSSRMHISC